MLTAQQLMQKMVRLQQPQFGEGWTIICIGTSRALPLNSLQVRLMILVFTNRSDLMIGRHYSSIGSNSLQTIDGINQTILLNISALMTAQSR